jgi:oxygen-independent coproporphyrinogen III oxidase
MIHSSPTAAVSSSPASLLSDSPYQGYAYAYPHKTAYRPLAPPLPLHELWAGENRSSLFLYAHVPFCEHRCGFCNLFTQANPEQGLTGRYLAQLRREAVRVRASLGEAAFARCAIGGGTPTFLTVAELEELFDILGGTMEAPLKEIPVSCEVSPATVDAEKLNLLRERGVDRLSIGVQSFDEQDAHHMGRPQRTVEVHQALERIIASGFPVLNIDLIYGGQGQTVERFLASVEEAIRYQAEEIYLYPIYVRPLTGLGATGRNWDDRRLESYRAARERLLEQGYRQVSMRMFRRVDLPADQGPPRAVREGPAYCCQSDGMVGIGVGARSYTRSVHYSTEYAVSRRGVAAVLGDYLSRPAETFESAQYGDRLPLDDQRRRFVIQSLLQAEGLDRLAYRNEFGADVLDHLPQLNDLSECGLAESDSARIVLTPHGLERSDAIGPWLYSPRVKRLMAEYELH